MSKHPEFHNIDDDTDAIVRQLAEGLTAHIYPGDQAMISVVTVEAGAQGTMHDHPEEQWGLCLEGSGIRFQGGEQIPFRKVISGARLAAFLTPCVPETKGAGFWIFAPPRDEYRKPGSGFGPADRCPYFIMNAVSGVCRLMSWQPGRTPRRRLCRTVSTGLRPWMAASVLFRQA